MCGAACEQDLFSKGFEVVKFVAGSFQDFDSVVVALTDTVGFVVISGALYVSTPVVDHVCNMAYLRNFRSAVNLEPYGQQCTMESRYDYVNDVMKPNDFFNERKDTLWLMKS